MGKRLKILMLHPHDIYSPKEPWTIRITSLAKELSGMGHKVRLIYFPLDRKDRGKLRQEKIKEYETVPFPRHRKFLIENCTRIVRMAKDYDIIHVQKCYPEAAIPALVSSYLCRKPLHYDWDDWEHGIYTGTSENIIKKSRIESWVLYLLEKNLPKLSDSISVASDELARMAISGGAAKKNIVKISVCADLDRFRPDLDYKDVLAKYGLKKPIVCYLGQLHGAQYADLFLEAAAKTGKKADFIVIGSGKDLVRLKGIASHLKITDRLKFTGFVPDEDLPFLLAGTDVAVASFVDNKQQRCKSPLKIAEYMASGCAIVASNVGETPWMIGDAGILVKPGSSISIANAIDMLLENPVKQKEYGLSARAVAEDRYNWKIAAETLVKSYTKALEE